MTRTQGGHNGFYHFHRSAISALIKVHITTLEWLLSATEKKLIHRQEVGICGISGPTDTRDPLGSWASLMGRWRHVRGTEKEPPPHRPEHASQYTHNIHIHTNASFQYCLTHDTHANRILKVGLFVDSVLTQEPDRCYSFLRGKCRLMWVPGAVRGLAPGSAAAAPAAPV